MCFPNYACSPGTLKAHHAVLFSSCWSFELAPVLAPGFVELIDESCKSSGFTAAGRTGDKRNISADNSEDTDSCDCALISVALYEQQVAATRTTIIGKPKALLTIIPAGSLM